MSLSRARHAVLLQKNNSVIMRRDPKHLSLSITLTNGHYEHEIGNLGTLAGIGVWVTIKRPQFQSQILAEQEISETDIAVRIA
jgi:hypothetical protein